MEQLNKEAERRRAIPALKKPLEDQLGPMLTDLLLRAEEADIPLWLDSGSLLGIVRDGELPPWDKDIDLGAWCGDIDVLRTLVQGVADAHGLQFSEKRLRGEPYALLLRAGCGRAKSNFLPTAIHLFERDGAFAVSPQPHYLLAKNARWARASLGLARERSLSSLCLALPFWRQQPSYTACVILHSLGLRRAAGLYVRVIQGASATGATIIKHPSERFGLGWLWVLLRWRVPARYFDRLDALPLGKSSLRIPSETESYLSLRYGDSWRLPCRDWFYALDDGAIERLSA